MNCKQKRKSRNEGRKEEKKKKEGIKKRRRTGREEDRKERRRKKEERKEEEEGGKYSFILKSLHNRTFQTQGRKDFTQKCFSSSEFSTM